MKNVKNISIKNYLANRGIHPSRETNNDGYYLSPFRTETTASFHVSYAKNLWHDFGVNQGGSIIDLVMQLEGCSVAEAFAKLKNSSHQPLRTDPAPGVPKTAPVLKITSVIPLNHSALIGYITQQRRVDIEVAQKYCKQVHYSINGKNYFAVGFRGDAGGWEFSAPGGFKLSTSPKSPTTMDRHSGECAVFEGFMDMLSFLTLKKDAMPDVNFVVLNSVANLGKAKEFICRHHTVHCFLDNDTAGRKALCAIQGFGIRTIDHSADYANYKDLNDYLRGKKMVVIPPKKSLRMKF